MQVGRDGTETGHAKSSNISKIWASVVQFRLSVSRIDSIVRSEPVQTKSCAPRPKLRCGCPRNKYRGTMEGYQLHDGA